MTEQTLAKVYEERAKECTRAAEVTDDPAFRRLLLMLASQWNFAAQEEAKRKEGSRGALAKGADHAAAGHPGGA